MGFRYPWKTERCLCFWLAEARPIAHLYSKSHSLLSQKQIVFTLMIALYHKICTIIWTYRTRPTIRNSSSGDAGFGAYALLYNALVERYDRLKAQYDEVSTAISDNEARYEQMGRFITVLKDQEGVITEFDDALWSSLVEKIVVKSKEDVTVVFKDGTEMKAE